MAGEGADAGRRVALIWDEGLGTYDFGLEHPLAPVRVELTVDLIRDLGLLDGPSAFAAAPGGFDEDELLRLHRPDFVRAVQRASADPEAGYDLAFGLGTGDVPVFTGMHDASLRVCAASKEAARLVWEGEAAHSFNPAGGLHHAMADRASGFCVYNDPAVAVDWLLEHGAERVCYLDVDVHHGDGVEHMFVDDPRVLTVSLHESGRFLFPGTGRAEDIGGPGALGSAANIPLYPGTTGDTWLGAFDAVVEPLVRAFAPDVLVTQFGCDTHITDPLAHLALTTNDFRDLAARVHRLAHEAAGGRWVATGGGGYQLVHVVPRAWSILFAEMSGQTLPTYTPLAWQERTKARTGERVPERFDDPAVEVSEQIRTQAQRAAAEAVDTVRALVLPRHGAR